MRWKIISSFIICLLLFLLQQFLASGPLLINVFAALAAIEINGHSLISSNHRSDVPNRLGATWVPEVAFPLVCHLDTTNNLDADKLDVSLDTWSQGVDYNVICPSKNQTIIS